MKNELNTKLVFKDRRVNKVQNERRSTSSNTVLHAIQISTDARTLSLWPNTSALALFLKHDSVLGSEKDKIILNAADCCAVSSVEDSRGFAAASAIKNCMALSEELPKGQMEVHFA